MISLTELALKKKHERAGSERARERERERERGVDGAQPFQFPSLLSAVEWAQPLRWQQPQQPAPSRVLQKPALYSLVW